MITYEMQGFKVECESVGAEEGFKHVAKLFVDDKVIDRAVSEYANRTWESFPFQTVMSKLIRNTEKLTDEQKDAFREVHLKDLT